MPFMSFAIIKPIIKIKMPVIRINIRSLPTGIEPLYGIQSAYLFECAVMNSAVGWLTFETEKIENIVL